VKSARFSIVMCVLIALTIATISPQAAYTVPKTYYDGMTNYSYTVTKSLLTAKPLLSVNLGRPTQTFDEMGRSLLVGNSLVYIKSGALKAVDFRTNRQLWAAVGKFRAPLFSKDNYLLISSADYVLHKIDLRTGKSLWNFRYALASASNQMTASSYSHSVSVSGDYVLLRYMESLTVLNRTTGKSLWRWSSTGSFLEDVYVVNGLVLVPSTFRTTTPSTFYYAFDIKTGKQKWLLIGSHGPLQTINGNLLYMEDLAFYEGANTHQLKLDAVDVTTGKVVSSKRYLSLPSANKGVEFGARKLSMVGNFMFVQGFDSSVYRFDIRQTPPLSVPKPLTSLKNWLAGPYNGKLFFMNDQGDGVTGVKTADGTRIVYNGLDNPVSRLLLDKSGLYVAQTDGELFFINLTTGRSMYRYQFATQRFASLQVSGSTLLAETEDQAYLFNLPTELLQPAP